MADARNIYQEHLDTVSALVWACEFEAAAGYLAYPSLLETSDASICLPSAASALNSLRSFRDSLGRLGAHAYYRICRGADFEEDNPDRIAGRHRTYVMRGGTYMVPPYDSDMVLERGAEHWCARGIRSRIRNADCSIILNPTGGGSEAACDGHLPPEAE